MKPIIKYEDNHLLILEKPAGWLVQADETGDKTLTDWAIDYIRKKYNKPGNVFCQPCHRLDRPVSGLVTFARTSKALERMNNLFRGQEVKKTYLAIVEGVPRVIENDLVHWLIKDKQKNMVKAYEQPKGAAKRATLAYKMIASHGKVSLLEIKPGTGRPHQIRVQMKTNETPIKGDLKYGYPKANQDKSINLHAFKLAFVHPVKREPLNVISKPKWPEFQIFIDELG
ncbi:MAG: RNA pseudouridine synthase [Ekhidna sp.]|nr:RNA pseudouridine synthase [Ekhidna sp.]MBC6411362.1 RNA pseudouridine synthase [Ekhidna sp.]MBC6425480.1 RNA pseudouridine synthase [Ekhidna sp.]